MSVIRARRLGLCLLVVVLLLSVTVSASPVPDYVVLLDEGQYYTIVDYLIYIRDALFYNNGSVDLSVADLLQNIQVVTEFIDGHLASSFEKISSIDDALHMTITSSNGTSTTYDMASIVYNHIGDKLDRIYNKLDSQSTSSSEFNSSLETYLQNINIRLNSIDAVIKGSISSPIVSIYQGVDQIRKFLMNEEDLETKESAKETQKTFNSEFGSQSRTDEMTKLSGLSTGMTDWFDLPDVDITSMWDQVESGYGRWFTSETAQAISVGGGSAAVAAATGIAVASDTEYVEPDTPYLDAWDQEVQDILAGGDGEW